MPRIAGVSTANPDYVLEQKDVKAFARNVFGSDSAVERLLPVFDNANIDSRHFSSELDWFATPHSFTEVNDRYIDTALALTERVLCDVADSTGFATSEFDAIFFISTTGLSTPSIDARLFNRIPLNSHIKRIPIWGLGCAGGAGGVARAADYLRAYPRERVIVVSVELCSLAFQVNDATKSNIIASALFADGAAACVMLGDEVAPRASDVSHPEVIGSLSTIYPDSLDVMGWRITDEGFKVVLSRDIPSIVTTLVEKNISELLQLHGIDSKALRHFVAHPGGTKVLQAYCDGLGINAQDLRHSIGVLREFGNMSSATVFFILERFLREVEEGSEEIGLLSALGPGFSSELVLLRWS